MDHYREAHALVAREMGVWRGRACPSEKRHRLLGTVGAGALALSTFDEEAPPAAHRCLAQVRLAEAQTATAAADRLEADNAELVR